MQKALHRSLYQSHSALQTQNHVGIYLAHARFAEEIVAACVCLQLLWTDTGNCPTDCVPKYSVASEFFNFLCHLMCTQIFLRPFEIECVMSKEYPGSSKRF